MTYALGECDGDDVDEKFKGVIELNMVDDNSIKPESEQNPRLETSRRRLRITEQLLHESFRVRWPTKELLCPG